MVFVFQQVKKYKLMNCCLPNYRAAGFLSTNFISLYMQK